MNANQEVTITFPRSFSTVYTAVASKSGTYGENAVFPYYAVNSLSNTGFKTRHYRGINITHWIAIGIS